MLEPLRRLVRAATRDTVIVMHMNGSHGPAYFRRYPDDFKAFAPTCETSQLHNCPVDSVRNAYDNTILYTDHILADAIGVLEAESARLDTAMLYVSDHGESLGEAATWLHGLPYAIAPEVQKHVPMIMWASTGYRDRQGLDFDCMQASRDAPLTHDHLFHSMLGLLNVRTNVYAPELDFSAHCRDAAGGGAFRRAAREANRGAATQAGG